MILKIFPAPLDVFLQEKDLLKEKERNQDKDKEIDKDTNYRDVSLNSEKLSLNALYDTNNEGLSILPSLLSLLVECEENSI